MVEQILGQSSTSSQLFFGDTSIFSKKYEQIVAKNFMADDKQDSYSRWLRAIEKKE
jgi:hypothetical protein